MTTRSSAAIVAMLTVARRGGQRVLWNGDCVQPCYQTLCEECGWLSTAVLSIGAALETACDACAERDAGAARRAAFAAAVCESLGRGGHAGAWLAGISAGRRVH